MNDNTEELVVWVKKNTSLSLDVEDYRIEGNNLSFDT